MTQALDLKVNNDQNLEGFLQVTVETRRKTQKCDRVIVYNASELSKALVIAKSIDAQYSSILLTIIQDPFLEGKHLEMYDRGLLEIINDIYEVRGSPVV